MPPRKKQNKRKPKAKLETVQEPIPKSVPELGPDIIHRILKHASSATVASCMRVSRHFYDIAGSILYRQLEYPTLKWRRIMLGADVVNSRGTRQVKGIDNLKNDLLAKVRVLEVSWHQCCEEDTTAQSIARLQALSTLRLVCELWCSCKGHFEICACACSISATNGFQPNLHPCRLMSGMRTDKIVLTTFREFNGTAIMKGISTLLENSDVLTIVISPDQLCCNSASARHIKNGIEGLSAGPKRLRVILAPWSKRIAATAYRGDGVYVAYDQKPVDLEQLIGFCLALVSSRYDTSIYFIKGLPASLGYPCYRETSADLSPIRMVENEVRSKLQASGRPHSVITFRDRLQYLREGVTDEIDEDEMNIWRKEQEAARALAEEQAFAGAEVLRLQLWRNMMAEAKDGLSDLGESVKTAQLEEALNWPEIEEVRDQDLDAQAMIDFNWDMRVTAMLWELVPFLGPDMLKLMPRV